MAANIIPGKKQMYQIAALLIWRSRLRLLKQNIVRVLLFIHYNA
jgi:hypothetical protein